MQETHNPAPVDWDPTMSIPKLLVEKRDRQPDKVQWEKKSSLGTSWVPVTVSQFMDEVNATAKGLVASGINPGDRVAIMAATRYEWTLFDFAIWQAGAIPVPIYQSDSAEQVRFISNDAGLKMIVTETDAQGEMCRALIGQAGELAEVLVIDEGAAETLYRRGADVEDSVIASRVAGTKGEDVATIIYTSGTTGQPKGVTLTHSNFVFITVAARQSFPEIVMVPKARTLMFLPLAHVFARFIEVLAVATDGVLGHCPDTTNLVADVGTFKPTFILSVPRVLEKIYNSADAKAGKGVKLKLFRWAAKTAITYSRELEKPGGPNAALKIQHRLAYRLVLRKITDLLGGNLEYIVSGGAPLGTRLGHFYRGAGLTVMEGYGLTETTAPLCVNLPKKSKIGTVGVAFPQTSARISETDEIEVFGPHVFSGYHNNPEATAESFTADGWFKTGDLGAIDDEGFISITGRAKDIIVTAGGKNVAPALLEDRLRGHPLVSQVLVVGDKKPFIGALITLDKDMLPQWLANKGLPALTAEQAATNEQVLRSLDKAVTRANEAVSRAESIRKWVVVTEDFTEENGLLTPSMKVKRGPAAQHFASEIAGIYGDGGQMDD